MQPREGCLPGRGGQHEIRLHLGSMYTHGGTGVVTGRKSWRATGRKESNCCTSSDGAAAPFLGRFDEGINVGQSCRNPRGFPCADFCERGARATIVPLRAHQDLTLASWATLVPCVQPSSVFLFFVSAPLSSAALCACACTRGRLGGAGLGVRPKTEGLLAGVETHHPPMLTDVSSTRIRNASAREVSIQQLLLSVVAVLIVGFFVSSRIGELESVGWVSSNSGVPDTRR